MTKSHPAFELIREQHIDSLNVDIQEFRHTTTGAQHIHIAADNDENVFLVALRTVPSDSTGVAHILEHTALCGSEKYPVRDPFFMMIRRSLNTFMNAFTSSDWTAYPFASKNKKDFNNLLDVYLDAVFFSRLDELDFLQEGHRLAFDKSDDPSSELQYKGVVYNEMKGAMSSVPSQLWQLLCKHLHPTNTYHHNSGGEPKNIPDLSYEDLKAFYTTHYHPSNAIFMTFGDISASEHQSHFEELALHRFEKSDDYIEVTDEQRFNAPISKTDYYTAESEDDKAHVMVSWLLGKSTDLLDALRSQLIAALLLENSASPLQHYLETSNLGSAPSPMNGIEDSQKEIIFVAGLEGVDPKDASKVEAQIINAIESLIHDGVEPERLEACLHQLELQQREVGGDGYPYGLQIILTALGSATHRGDCIDLLDLDKALAQLRLDIQNPNFIAETVKSLFIDNPHRLTLTVEPDAQLADALQQEERSKLDRIRAELSDDEVQTIIDQAQALEARQNQEDDPGQLPKVGIEDVPVDICDPESHTSTLNGWPLWQSAAGTNGLTYTQLIFDLPNLNEDELKLIPYLTSIITELGIKDEDYLAVQNRQSATCGSISAFSSIRCAREDLQTVKGYFALSIKGLNRNHEAMMSLLHDTATSIRFDETKRIKELVAQIRSRRENSITGNGHAFAMGAASSHMSGLAYYQYQSSGIEGIRFLKKTDDALKDTEALNNFCADLAALYNKLTTQNARVALITEAEFEAQAKEHMTELGSHHSQGTSGLKLPSYRECTNSFWQINSQVSFCAKAYPVVGASHEDAPALTVLGGVLRNGYLHRAIREQGGAYGGGASYDASSGAFRFYSYRDPRNVDTLNDFDQSIQWVINTDISFDQVEESILGVISSLDKPASPAGEAKQALFNELHDRDLDYRKNFRSRVLAVTADDLKQVAKKYLLNKEHSTVILSGENNAHLADELNLELEVL